MSLVVKSHNPWKTRIFYSLGVIILLTAGWSIYDYGRFNAGFDSHDARVAESELLGIKDDLERQISELREQKALLERAAQIEREAYNDLDATLKVLQGEILELKEELAFYRGIVSPKDASRGLQLQSVKLESNGVSRSFHYKIVLTQVLKNDNQAYGKLKLSVEGLKNKEPLTLAMNEVSEKRVKDLNYRFRYFQNIEGDLELPEGFEPLRLNVQILPKSRQEDMIEKTIEWSTEESTAHVGKK